MPLTVPRRGRLLAVACVVAGAAALPSTASAGLLVDAAPSCEEQTLSRPFTPWLDLAQYTPAPNGGFEAGASGWALDDAQVVPGNEPFDIAGDGGTRSLHIAAGGSATSSAICVGIEHPSIRFMAKRTTGGLAGLLSSLRVEIIYENNLGLLETLPIGLVLGSTSWAPTSPFLMVANLLPLLSGEMTPVAFRFTPQGPSAWQVDGVFVDPWRGR